MTNKQILKKAIEKAVENGYKDKIQLFNLPIPEGYELEDVFASGCHYAIIFSYDFAKPFFGKDYLWHLQQMVTEKEPLKYLEIFMAKKKIG